VNVASTLQNDDRFNIENTLQKCLMSVELQCLQDIFNIQKHWFNISTLQFNII